MFFSALISRGGRSWSGAWCSSPQQTRLLYKARAHHNQITTSTSCQTERRSAAEITCPEDSSKTNTPWRLEREGCTGNFWYFLVFWRAGWARTLDRPSLFARPCPRIWTYAPLHCRTACLGRISRARSCNWERRCFSRKKQSWTRRKPSGNWPPSWRGAKVRARPSPETRGSVDDGRKRAPRTQWEMCQGVRRTHWLNSHGLYSRSSRGWRTWRYVCSPGAVSSMSSTVDLFENAFRLNCVAIVAT